MTEQPGTWYWREGEDTRKWTPSCDLASESRRHSTGEPEGLVNISVGQRTQMFMSPVQVVE